MLSPARTTAGPRRKVLAGVAAARFGFDCTVFMGAEDVRRKELLGAQVIPATSGTSTLKDAMNEALRYWSGASEATFYVIGTVSGHHPYPEMVRDFQRVIGNEARTQFLEKCGRLPVLLVAPTTRPDRIQKIAQETGGFLYLITKAGTTGEGGLDYSAIAKHAAAVKAVSPLPVCLGFGIRDGSDAAKLAPMADGIVVGSTLVNVIASAPTAPDLPARMVEKIQDLRAGLDRP